MVCIARSKAGLAALSLLMAGAVAYPAFGQTAQAQKNAPTWERPKLTRFSAMRCAAGTPSVIGQLTLNRDDDGQTTGFATYYDASRDHGFEHGAGGWSLDGPVLRVQGEGFELEGRWVGPILTAVITRTSSHARQRCRFQVTTLRSFTQYQ